MRTLSLAILLCAFWFCSSGRTDPLLLGCMAVSVVLVVLVARRLGVLDAQGHPIHLVPRAIPFWIWLAGQVVLSSFAVLRVILSPRMPIAPSVLRVPASQRDEVGRTIHANCVSLTPGTVSLDVDDDSLLVHALTKASAAALRDGEMDRRVTAVAGGRA